MKRVLIYHSWGLGDTVMATPMFKALYKSGYEVNIIVTSKTNKKILENSNFIKNIYILSNYKKILFFVYMNYGKFDFLIATLGINPNKVQLLSYLFGIKKYFAKYNEDNIHRIKDNLIVVKELLNKNIIIDKPYINMINLNSKKIKSKYIKKNKKNIGFSIGSGYKQIYKRWGVDNYIKLFKYYENENLLVFIGPDEKDLKEKLVNIKNITIVNEQIENIISIINSLDLLVGTDNGLMHIGYGLEKETITFYGMTNEKEIGGYNPLINHNIYLDIECRPCINSKTKIFKCDKEIECLKNISFEFVSEKINKILYKGTAI